MNSKQWKTDWDLSTLYTSINDPQIETDIKNLERASASFVKVSLNQSKLPKFSVNISANLPIGSIPLFTFRVFQNKL